MVRKQHISKAEYNTRNSDALASQTYLFIHPSIHLTDIY